MGPPDFQCLYLLSSHWLTIDCVYIYETFGFTYPPSTKLNFRLPCPRSCAHYPYRPPLPPNPMLGLPVIFFGRLFLRDPNNPGNSTLDLGGRGAENRDLRLSLVIRDLWLYLLTVFIYTRHLALPGLRRTHPCTDPCLQGR